LDFVLGDKDLMLSSPVLAEDFRLESAENLTWRAGDERTGPAWRLQYGFRQHRELE